LHAIETQSSIAAKIYAKKWIVASAIYVDSLGKKAKIDDLRIIKE
jgi:hypothetical protein